MAYERPRRDIGFHFVDQVAREAKAAAGIEALTANSYTVRSTIIRNCSARPRRRCRRALARYERNTGRSSSRAPRRTCQGGAADRAGTNRAGEAPPWQQALEKARLPLYDVHWTPAVVVEKPGRQEGRDHGASASPTGASCRSWRGNATAQRKLNLHDVVYVRVVEGKGKTPARAELRVRPMVQGAAVVLENKTGRILAMAGGFSYPLSQLNRATQAQRQPGSGDQAADLSRGARARACSPTRW